jgi:DnaD/phage-associated family protein
MNTFGHEGISAWWQLLEHLGDTENHYICLRSQEDLELLASQMHFQPNRLIEILVKLAELEAIDIELFNAGVIWCQNFVDRLEPVYKKRKVPLPQKPLIKNVSKQLLLPEISLSLSGKPLMLPVIPQSKVKESRVKESREETVTAASLKDDLSEITVDGNETDNNIAIISTCYEQNIGMLTPKIAEELRDLSREYSAEWFSEAVSEACRSNARRLNYVTRILERWKVDGFKSQKTGGGNGKGYQAGNKQLANTEELAANTERFLREHGG